MISFLSFGLDYKGAHVFAQRTNLSREVFVHLIHFI